MRTLAIWTSSFYSIVPWLIVGCVAWLWWRNVADLRAQAVALLALGVLVGGMGYLLRARSQRRWRAALDQYAEQELARWAYIKSRRAANRAITIAARADSRTGA